MRLPSVAIICLFDPIHADFRPLGIGSPKHANKAVNIGVYWYLRVLSCINQGWRLPSPRAFPTLGPGSRVRSPHRPHDFFRFRVWSFFFFFTGRGFRGGGAGEGEAWCDA